MKRNRIVALFPGLLLTGGLLWAAPAAAETVPDRPEEVQPLGIGATVPSAPLSTVDGKPADLAALVRDAGALLVFYRGGW